MDVPLPSWFKVPQIHAYDRSTDSIEHIENFKALMTLHRYQSGVSCKALSLMLKGTMKSEFGTLPPNLVESFEKLANVRNLTYGQQEEKAPSDVPFDSKAVT